MKNKTIVLIIVISLIIAGGIVYVLKRPPVEKAIVSGEKIKAVKGPKGKTEPFIEKRVVSETKAAKKADPGQILIDKLGDPDIQVAMAAADELVKEGKEAVPKLIARLSDASVGLKGQIVFLLGRIGDKEAVPVLIELLNTDENSYIRRNAAEALGKIQDARAVSCLARSLFDGDISIRERSALALGKINNTQATGGLLDRLQDEKEERVRSAVVTSLGALKDQRATQTLLAGLKQKNNQLYTDQIVFSLGEIGDPASIPDLTAYLKGLKSNKPKEKILLFQWEEAVKTAEQALAKIKKSQ